ncbi:MAG: anti-sigma factor family protein [Halocynthiibacter sp.]
MTVSPSIEELMQRGIDGDLSREEHLNLTQYLAENPKAAAEYDRLLQQTKMIGAAVPVPSAAHLKGLRTQAKNTQPPALRLAASVAIFAVGVGVGQFWAPQDRDMATGLTLFAQQAKAAHSLYVSEVLHPVEVAASEKEHLQTWLSNRLGSAIIAPKLGETGFSLIGGRLLPAGVQASALFMYENAKGDRLSLVATHSASRQNQSFRFQNEDGYLVVSWQDGPWQYSLVGDQQKEPMDQIAQLVHGQMKVENT